MKPDEFRVDWVMEVLFTFSGDLNGTKLKQKFDIKFAGTTFFLFFFRGRKPVFWNSKSLPGRVEPDFQCDG